MSDLNDGHVEKAGKCSTDPVCGMTVQIGPATQSATHDGETYHFCSRNCLDKFYQEPGCYATKGQPSAPKAPASEQTGPSAEVEYTCPMHSEIIRSAPGSCPICAMALEPRTPATGCRSEEFGKSFARWIATDAIAGWNSRSRCFNSAVAGFAS
jgi:Cu+-exporting ATPase